MKVTIGVFLMNFIVLLISGYKRYFPLYLKQSRTECKISKRKILYSCFTSKPDVSILWRFCVIEEAIERHSNLGIFIKITTFSFLYILFHPEFFSAETIWESLQVWGVLGILNNTSVSSTPLELTAPIHQ